MGTTNIYQIQDSDGSGYIEASSMAQAVLLWREKLQLENAPGDIEEDYEPEGVILLATQESFITRDRIEAWKREAAANVDAAMRDSMMGKDAEG